MGGVRFKDCRVCEKDCPGPEAAPSMDSTTTGVEWAIGPVVQCGVKVPGAETMSTTLFPYTSTARLGAPSERKNVPAGLPMLAPTVDTTVTTLGPVVVSGGPVGLVVGGRRDA